MNERMKAGIPKSQVSLIAYEQSTINLIKQFLNYILSHTLQILTKYKKLICRYVHANKT